MVNKCLQKIRMTDFVVIVMHCSPESNLVKKAVPDKPTTNSESPLHGDFESGVGFGLGSSATETVQNCNTFINQKLCSIIKNVTMAERIAHWSCNLMVRGSSPPQVEFFLSF